MRAAVALAAAALLLAGCNSWASRMFVSSLGRLGADVQPAPRMITTPYRPEARLAVAWSGHATMLVQIDDKLILTDPLFTTTVGIVVKRYTAAALDPSVLPRLDLTLISHLHFDHFSYASLADLPKDGALVVPKGALPYTPEFGFRELKELGAWESVTTGGIRVTAVPVRHFGGRYGFDRAWTDGPGYTGYVVEYDSITVFVAGDTGYDDTMFKEIGNRFRIDLAFIPIGPGSSRGIGGGIHVSPGGALQIFRDVGARFMAPMHHATLFYGSDDDPRASISTLRQLAVEQGLSDRVVDLDVGDQRVLIRRSTADGSVPER